MTYDINTISQSDLLKLLLSVKEQYSIDAIDGEKAKDELEQQEKALLRRKQLENEIAKSGFSRNEILDYISVKTARNFFLLLMSRIKSRSTSLAISCMKGNCQFCLAMLVLANQF